MRSTLAEAFQFLISVRFLLSIILFVGIAIQYAHKSDISVAIVCMINHTQAEPPKNGSSFEHSGVYKIPLIKVTHCLFENSTDDNDPDGPYTWSKNIQEFVLSSYFYGYLISQVSRSLSTLCKFS
jgi:ACS family sodium-dependent inorganic phosphate cotransporter-like MFS transporter 5